MHIKLYTMFVMYIHEKSQKSVKKNIEFAIRKSYYWWNQMEWHEMEQDYSDGRLISPSASKQLNK